MSHVLHRLRFWRDHRWAPAHMSAYLDADLAAAPRRRMERHVGECRECRRLMDGLRQVIEALHRLTTPAGGAQRDQITAAVHARIARPPEA